MTLEFSFQVDRVGDRLQVVVRRGDEVLLLDKVDGASEVSRQRLLDKLREKAPSIDASALEQEIINAAVASTAADPSTAAGAAVELKDAEPWPEPVDGNKLLQAIVVTLGRFIAFPSPEAQLVCALWALGTHAAELLEYAPRLSLLSPERRSGKSKLLRLLAAISRRPLLMVSMSPASLFRIVEAVQPTAFLDEADQWLLQRNAPPELLAFLNDGFERHGRVYRTADTGHGHEVRAFRVFAWVAISGIASKLPPALADRALHVRMQRRRPSDKLERLVWRDVRDDLERLQRMCARWVADHRAALRDARPALPRQLDDRAADAASPLLAIADLAGGEWPSLARHALVTLAGDRPDAAGLGVQLLRDLQPILTDESRQVHAPRSGWHVPTESLLGFLLALDDRPWPTLRRGRPIDARKLAELLEAFGVRPTDVRVAGGTKKAYPVEPLLEACERYLPAEGEPADDAEGGADEQVAEPVAETAPAATEDWSDPSRHCGNGVAAEPEEGPPPWPTDAEADAFEPAEPEPDGYVEVGDPESDDFVRSVPLPGFTPEQWAAAAAELRQGRR